MARTGSSSDFPRIVSPAARGDDALIATSRQGTGQHGLTPAEAARRLAADGPNELPRPAEPSILRRALGQLLEPLSLVLLVAALASVVVLGHTGEGIAIAAIVVLNVAIGTSQEQRSAGAVAALERLTAPMARLRRDGASRVVPAREVVQGDLVELAAGDRVPADLVLLEASSLAADEALLTGESLPAEKQQGDEAYAGTLVVRGRGLGEVAATGARTRVGAIATGLARVTEPPLVVELRLVAARMSALAIVLGACLVPILFARGAGTADRVASAVLGGVALAVAAIPEGLPTVVTTSLALGARRMAERGAIVRRLAAIEALGAADVICSDKTGTLTTGRLTVAGVTPAEGRLHDLWRACVRCNDAERGIGDPVDVALVTAAAGAGVQGTEGRRVAELPFDTERRAMTTVHLTADGPVVSVKGAPEVVLARCAAGPDRKALEAAYAEIAGGGLRVLAVAAGAGDDLEAGGLEPLGLVAFHDPLRESAAETIARCRAAGIRVVLVTGDHVGTALAVASAAGINGGPAVTGPALAELSDDDRRRALLEASVVARVDPATKVALVEAHRAAGHVVAMTGDGVNDAPALRRADIGVALAGEGGTDVAREAAALVVTDGDLATVIEAVSEGRRIYRNLQAVVGYLVTGNLSEIMTLVLALVVLPELAVPLLPVQLLWINLVTDGLPALALGVDRPPQDPLDGRPHGREGKLLPLARLGTLSLQATVIAGTVALSGAVAKAWGWAPVLVRTQLLLTLLVAHLGLAYAARATRWTLERGWWRNRVVMATVAGSLVLQVVAFETHVGRRLLGLGPLPARGWMLAAVCAIGALALLDVLRAVGRILSRSR